VSTTVFLIRKVFTPFPEPIGYLSHTLSAAVLIFSSKRIISKLHEDIHHDIQLPIAKEMTKKLWWEHAGANELLIEVCFHIFCSVE